MTRLHTARAIALAAALVALPLLGPTIAFSQKGKAPPPKGADDLLKPTPRPKRPALPPSKLPLEVIKGERIAFVAKSPAERFNLFGHFETMLPLRFPDKELVVRNFARPADEVANRQRASDYTKLDDPLAAFGPDTFLCFFGFNESFAGKDGVEKFKADYEKFLEEYARKYPRDDAGSQPRFVLVSPIAFEATGDPLLPSGEEHNENLKLYAAAAKDVAAKRGLAFIDVFTPTDLAFGKEQGMQLTINGCHQNDAGDKLIGMLLDTGLFGGPHPG